MDILRLKDRVARVVEEEFGRGIRTTNVCNKLWEIIEEETIKGQASAAELRGRPLDPKPEAYKD